MLRRDLRRVEIRLLLLALVVAVMAVTTVGFFSARIEGAMRLQATALFGADLVVRSTRPLPARYRQAARAVGLRVVSTVSFPSMARAGDSAQLVRLKAVEPGYPLRGRLETSARLGQPGAPTSALPAAGEAWVEARGLQRLGIAPGDRLQLGHQRFRVTRVLTFEAAAGGSLFQMAPRVLIARDSLEATGLLRPASRASFELLLAGAERALAVYRKQMARRLRPWERLQGIEGGRPEITSALERATRFMRLATLLTIVLAGAAIALAVHAFNRRERRAVAVRRALGATRGWLWRFYLRRLAALLSVGVALGALAGYLAQFALAGLLGDWIGVPLPPAGPGPLWSGFVTALLSLAGFAAPPLHRLIGTPPLRILREPIDAAPGAVQILPAALAMVAAIGAFLWWQAGEARLAGLLLGAVILAGVVLWGLAWGLSSALRGVLPGRAGGWRMGLANIARYRRRSALLMAAFGLAIFTLVLLGGVRDDLIGAWRASVPADAPNHFLIGIQPGELDALRAFLDQRGLRSYHLYPMARARLIARNGRPIGPDDYPGERAKRLVSREFFLSAATRLPAANELLAGVWGTRAGGLSLEQGLAETLGLTLGDRLGFDLAGRRLSLPVTSLRKVHWDSMQPNFFVMLPPEALRGLDKTYITSVHVAAGDGGFTAALTRNFPGITDLDVRALLAQVRRIIEQASAAVEFVFAFSLLAGVVVLLAAVQTQRSERRRESALWKTLGATRRMLRAAVASEFLVLGAIAGALGGGLALLSGWLLATRVFDLAYLPSPWPWLAGVVGGAALLGAIGWWMLRGVVAVAPMRLLRAAQG